MRFNTTLSHGKVDRTEKRTFIFIFKKDSDISKKHRLFLQRANEQTKRITHMNAYS